MCCSYASTYQMLRGTLVLFAGLFTITILRRQLYIHHFLGMVLITAGAALVGASSVIYQDAPGSSGDNSGTGTAAAAAALGAWVAGNATQLAAAAGGGTGWASGASSGLHYDAGLSRVAARGLHGLQQAGSSSSSSSWGARLLGGGEVAAAPLFGDMLVVAAQMFTALQFILEEKFLVKYKVRVQHVRAH